MEDELVIDVVFGGGAPIGVLPGGGFHGSGYCVGVMDVVNVDTGIVGGEIDVAMEEDAEVDEQTTASDDNIMLSGATCVGNVLKRMVLTVWNATLWVTCVVVCGVICYWWQCGRWLL